MLTVETCMTAHNSSHVSYWHSESTPSPGAVFSLESQRTQSRCTEFTQNSSVPLDMKITHRYYWISDAFLLILLMQQISKIQQTVQGFTLTNNWHVNISAKMIHFFTIQKEGKGKAWLISALGLLVDCWWSSDQCVNWEFVLQFSPYWRMTLERQPIKYSFSWTWRLILPLLKQQHGIFKSC